MDAALVDSFWLRNMGTIYATLAGETKIRLPAMRNQVGIYLR